MLNHLILVSGSSMMTKKPFVYIEDPRLLYLQSMATMFKGMNTYSASTKTLN